MIFLSHGAIRLYRVEHREIIEGKLLRHCLFFWRIFIVKMWIKQFKPLVMNARYVFFLHSSAMAHGFMALACARAMHH